MALLLSYSGSNSVHKAAQNNSELRSEIKKRLLDENHAVCSVFSCGNQLSQSSVVTDIHHLIRRIAKLVSLFLADHGDPK
jgi:hypothetical protein